MVLWHPLCLFMLEGEEDVQYALQKRGQRRRRRRLLARHVGVYATKTNVCACLEAQ